MRAEQRRLALGAVALFVVLAVVYTASIGLRATRGASITGDEPFYLLTTQSLLDDGDIDLRQQYERASYRAFFDHPEPLWRQAPPRPDGRLLSPHDPGLSVYLVPGFAVGGLRGAQVEMLLTAAAGFALAFVLIARETGTSRLAWLATLAVGLTATAFVYATEIYPEVPAALCLVLALLVLRAPVVTTSHAVGLAVLVTALAWFGVKYVPLGVLVAAVAMWRGDTRGRLWLIGLGAVSGIAYVWWHLATFGGLTAYGANNVYAGEATVEVVRAHLSVSDRAYRLVGLFVDRRFGLGRWAPVLLLAVPVLPLRVRRGRVGTLVATLIGVQIMIATFVAVTMMGWWFPGRTLMAVLPLMAWPLTEVLVRLPVWGRAVVGGLAAYSMLLTLALTRASRASEVRLAVDPFDMTSIWFQAPAGLFPDYRAWTLETTMLHACWLTVGLGALGWVFWREYGTTVRRRLPRAGVAQTDRDVPSVGARMRG